MEPTESPPKPKRRPGRPKRADAPIIDWDEVDRLLVFGERCVDSTTGQEAIKFPSLRELGQRLGVSAHRVWQYSNKARCYKRRAEAHLKTQARFEDKVIEKVASARALATGDLVRVTDTFISAFERELSEGRVRADSPADFDRLSRLRELLLGRSDTRSELHGELSLSAIQERHRKLRGQVEGMTPALTGTGDATPRELAGVVDADSREIGGELDAGGRELRGEEAGDDARH